MATSLANTAATAHRISIEDVRPEMAKAALNNVEKPDFRAQIGKALQRAISLAGLNQKEAAGRIGREPAQLARWIAGTERPQFDALFAIEELREPLCVALAQMAGARISTRISFPKMKRTA